MIATNRQPVEIVPAPTFDDERYNVWLGQFRAAHNVWIAQRGDLYGYCQGAAHEMAQAFPELHVARGYVTLGGPVPIEWDPDEEIFADGHGHWWCVRTADNVIIDPTACQFYRAFGGRHPLVSEYEEHDDAKHGKLPTGKCPECGMLVYDDRYVHEECEVAWRAYLESER